MATGPSSARWSRTTVSTTPSRVASKGRLAVSGSSLRVVIAFIAAKPATVMGVIVASVLFVRRVAHVVTVTRTLSADAVHYDVDGALFFASSNDLTTQFEYAEDPGRVVIDMSRSHIWDASTVAALDAIVTKYAQHGKHVTFEGMNEATASFHGRLTGGLGSLH